MGSDDGRSPVRGAADHRGPPPATLDRRGLLRGLLGLGAVGLAGGALAGCSRLLDDGGATGAAPGAASASAAADRDDADDP
jgi:hypothetical protein